MPKRKKPNDVLENGKVKRVMAVFENVAGNGRVIFYCPICGSSWKIWKVPMTALSETFMRDQAMAQLQRSIKDSPTARLTLLTVKISDGNTENGQQRYRR